MLNVSLDCIAKTNTIVANVKDVKVQSCHILIGRDTKLEASAIEYQEKVESNSSV